MADTTDDTNDRPATKGISANIPTSLYERLNDLKWVRRTTMNAMVREALSEYVERYEKS